MAIDAYVSLNYEVVPAGSKYVILLADYGEAEGRTLSILTNTDGEVVLYSTASQAEAAIKAAMESIKQATKIPETA